MHVESVVVDTQFLRTQGCRMLDHVDVWRREHSGYLDELMTCAAAWNGQTADALTRVGNAWEDQGKTLHTKVGQCGTTVVDASQEFAAQAERSQSYLYTIGKNL